MTRFSCLAWLISTAVPARALDMELWSVPGESRGLNSLAAVVNSTPRKVELAGPALRSAAIAEARQLVRIRGVLIPPATGEYRFAVAADDSARLDLSDNATPFRCQAICRLEFKTPPGKWSERPGQISESIALEEGKPRYFEAWCFNEGGTGHLEIGWSLPGNEDIKPIPLLAEDGTPLVSPYLPDTADADDNGLLDEWEKQTGIAIPTGAPSIVAFADPDGDGASNRVEFISKSDPLKPECHPGKTLAEVWPSRPTGFYGEPMRQRVVLMDGHLQRPPPVSGLVSGVRPHEHPAPCIHKFRGFITPSLSGDYRFRVRGQGRVRMLISPDETVLRKEPVFEGGRALQGRNFDLQDRAIFPDGKPVRLLAGSSCYFEILFYQERRSAGFSFEWLRPDGVRESVPAGVMRAYVIPPDDEDGDDLPDAWEKQRGLSVSGRETAHFATGDTDHDGLSNGDEYLAGSNPLDPDTDADGVSDRAEVELLGTSPDDVASPAGPAGSIDLFAAKPLTHGWSRKEPGTYESEKGQPAPYPDTTLPSLSSATGCGSVEWPVTARQSGFHLVTLDCQLTGNADYRSMISQWWIDGIQLPDVPVIGPCMSLRRITFVTQWMAAGKHTFRLQLRSQHQLSPVRLFKLQFQPVLPGAPTASLRKQLAAENRFTRGTGDSRTSPACVELTARVRQTTTLIAGKNRKVPLKPTGATGSWAEIPLPEDGSALQLTATAENGGLIHHSAVRWIPSNALVDGRITVRQGDALRLVSTPPDAVAGRGSVVIAGKEHHADPGKPAIHRFTQAGEIRVHGKFVPAAGGTPLEGFFDVTVLAPPPPVAPGWACVGTSRLWIDSLGSAFTLDGARVAECFSDPTKGKIGIFPIRAGDFVLPIRISGDGPISSTFTLRSSEISSVSTWVPPRWEPYNFGTDDRQLPFTWRAAALVTNPPAGAQLRFISTNLNFWWPAAGKRAEDALLPVSAATEEGIMSLYFIGPPDSNKPFDHDVRLVLPDGREL